MVKNIIGYLPDKYYVYEIESQLEDDEIFEDANRETDSPDEVTTGSNDSTSEDLIDFLEFDWGILLYILLQDSLNLTV